MQSSDKSKGVGEESLLLAALSIGKAPSLDGRARDNMRPKTAWEMRGRGTHTGEEFAQRLSFLNACVVVGMRTVTHGSGMNTWCSISDAVLEGHGSLRKWSHAGDKSVTGGCSTSVHSQHFLCMDKDVISQLPLPTMEPPSPTHHCGVFLWTCNKL